MGFTGGTRLTVVASDCAVVLQRVEVLAGKIRMKDLLDRIKTITSKLSLG